MWVDKTQKGMIGKEVRLSEDKMAMVGGFTKGSIVKITGYDPVRGYTFTDAEGHQVIEAGWEGFTSV